jgi:hypothetical protein
VLTGARSDPSFVTFFVCCKNARLTAIRVKKVKKGGEEEKKLESKVEETQAKLMERNAFEKQSGCHSFQKNGRQIF